jgi:hypothetical protein
MPAPDRKPYAMVWTLVVVAAVLLYVLTLPWIYAAQFNATIRKTTLSNEDVEFLFFPLHSGQGFLGYYSRPYAWLARTPLKAPLEQYWTWCLKRYGRR